MCKCAEGDASAPLVVDPLSESLSRATKI